MFSPEAVDALVDRLYALGWNAALTRVDREIRAHGGPTRRMDKADVLTILLKLERPPTGPLARVIVEDF